jgi:uncharacterized protein with PIN domain
MSEQRLKFIVDHNVAKLARFLRMMGYDTIVFNEKDDWQIVRIALAEDRIIITRDTGVMKRRIITSGKLKALLVTDDAPAKQILQVIKTFNLDTNKSLMLCMECNTELIPIDREKVKDRVPPYVYQTKKQFGECPVCLRVYWQGTHWEAMKQTLRNLDNIDLTVNNQEKMAED